MDPLTALMLQRAAPPQPPPLPVVPPSGGASHVPPEAQRFLTAQAMMNAVRSGGSPLLTQVTQNPR